MDGAWRRPPKSLSDYGHTEPKRGAEWWGKSVLLGLSPGSVRHEAGYPVFCLKLFAYSFGERYPRAECSRLLL